MNYGIKFVGKIIIRSKIRQSKPAMQVYFVEKGALHIGDIPENEKVKDAMPVFGFSFSGIQ